MRRKKIYLIIVSVSVFAIGAVVYMQVRNVANNSIPAPETNTINYGPPTDAEMKSGDNVKDKVLEKTTANNSSEISEGSQDNPTPVIITDAGQYDDVIEVRAFMPDAYEDGSCIILFSKNQESLSRTTSAYRDATTTICTNPLIKKEEFSSPGEWTVTVKYISDSYEGLSEERIFAVE